MELNPIRSAVYPLVALLLLLLPSAGVCGVPPLLNFQGRIVISGTTYSGAGQFQFALVNGAGANTFWSNDGTSSAGSEPSASITLTLTNGLYSVLLGDTTVSGMTQPLNTGIFTNSDVRLRVWFNDGTHGFELLAPDQRIAASGYALVADTANNFTGSISGSQLPANTATTNFVTSQGYVTASVTNGLATAAYVNTATNGLVTSAVTNGLATTNFVFALNYVTASVTNGLATVSYVNYGTNFAGTNDLALLNSASNVLAGKIISITNGLATTNWVGLNYYPTSNPSAFITAAVTNGLATTNFVTSQGYVTASVTNGLATTAYVNTATNGLVTSAVTNGLATISFVLASQTVPAAIWSGVSGNTLAAGSTHYAMPNNSTSMTPTVQTNGVTSVPATESLTLTNLYVATSANLGTGHTATLTIMTNGVASPIAVTISGSSQTAGNDTIHGVTVPAGTLIGVRVVTGSSVTAVYWSWSFEGW